MIDEGGNEVGQQGVEGNLVKSVGGELPYFTTLLVQCPNVCGVEELLGGGEGAVLGVLGGNGQLAAELSLGGGEGAGREGNLSEAVQLAVHQTQTAVHVLMVTTKVDGPEACISVGGGACFYSIDKAGSISQRLAEARVHGGTSQHVHEQGHSGQTRVGEGKGTSSEHHVCLVGAQIF